MQDKAKNESRKFSGAYGLLPQIAKDALRSLPEADFSALPDGQTADGFVAAAALLQIATEPEKIATFAQTARENREKAEKIASAQKALTEAQAALVALTGKPAIGQSAGTARPRALAEENVYSASEIAEIIGDTDAKILLPYVGTGLPLPFAVPTAKGEIPANAAYIRSVAGKGRTCAPYCPIGTKNPVTGLVSGSLTERSPKSLTTLLKAHFAEIAKV